MNAYIGTYAKYNDGNLYGSWLRLEDFNSKDEFLKAAVSLSELRSSIYSLKGSTFLMPVKYNSINIFRLVMEGVKTVLIL